MADFMRKYMAQKSRRESPLFRHPLNPIVEDIPAVTQPFLIQRGGAEHIGTITHFGAHGARKDLQHEVSGPYDVATGRLNILRAVSPNSFHSRLPKNPMHLHLCGGQEFWGNLGVVVDRDMEFWAPSLFCRSVLSEARRRQKHEGQEGINAGVALHGCHLMSDAASPRQQPQCYTGNE